MKTCTKCKTVKDEIEGFRIRDAKTGRRQSWCRACENNRKIEQRANPAYREKEKAVQKITSMLPEMIQKRKEAKLKSRYGITLEHKGII